MRRLWALVLVSGSWNCPDLCGGIATETEPSASAVGNLGGTSLISTEGLRLARQGTEGNDLARTWNFPDLYGGIATSMAGVGNAPGRRRALGTSLICTVGLRPAEEHEEVENDGALGTALIGTVGLRRSDDLNSLSVEVDLELL